MKNKTINIDLINQTQQGLTLDTTKTLLWSNDENELLVSHLLIN